MIDGVRYSFPGDLAMVAEDGTLILLGRGSQVINTGGEKVFPEEVEEAVKRVDGIVDCLVVGVENEKFGQAVTAVASVADGATVDEATVIAAVKSDLAGYKAPKSVVFVPTIPRAPNGKADYKTARSLAESSIGLAPGGREQLLDEEVEDPLDARVVALLGQHRVIRLRVAREFDRDERVTELLAQGVEPRRRPRGPR